ncbi:MAG TPA: LUD domain-containing protein [Candidatus Binataceae bacterium]|nr:LUD domain-containing protein [Candidatus Binataceae bacterium]
MSTFHKLIANVKTALERAPRPAAPGHAADGGAAMPVAGDLRRTELIAQFARELAAVGGVFLGALTADQARLRIVALARELGAKAAACGAGVTIDLAPIARALEQAGVAITRADRKSVADRAAYRDRLAHADLGIVEAHAAIAATGTLAVVGAADRPNSLTLLPPANLILVHADRVMPDLAAAVAALGTATFVTNRVALITGPSRTADIEKMIVLGVHGPKQLYAIAVWPAEGAR